MYTLPQKSTYDFYRHILLTWDLSTLYCFAPKTGCTNLRVLFYVSQGLLPKSELYKSRDKVNQEHLETLMSRYSFTGMDNKSRIEAMKHSFKFVMWRNPLERLASIYRSKIERFPLIGLERNKPHYNFIRRGVYQYTHEQEYAEWERKGGVTSVNISFGDFIDYWIYSPREMATDEHFQTLLYMCQPCRVRYNFYADFKNFDEDSLVLTERLGGKATFLRQGYYNTESSTDRLLQTYYHQLNYQQKRAIIRKLSKELDFHYRLFPSESGIHKTILEITDDLPSHY